ncbi:unnamed protein product [Callosobruchus maculatus]|uniref:Methionine--tRNA ligase, mitochondrial n=1 Tax=Callosobruchus maculatus TaxID=64391 RepID=A0A653BJR8_CALMS|nr:unnamed protein product [Callosobruchus maculatus]
MCNRTFMVLRHFSGNVKSVKFFTTPIYYVNANPHIGHLYSSVIADAVHRWQDILERGQKSEFSTGTDEHGSKIQQAASKRDIPSSIYCATVSEQFKRLSDEFGVGYTKFVRTSDESHKATVGKFWKKLLEEGHIYKSAYEGYYCIQDETFLTETQLKEVTSQNGDKMLVSLETGHSVEWTKEENYMFKLNSFQDDLIHWLKSDENLVRPKIFHKILLDMLSNDLQDLSVSRPSSRVHWAIPVPEDDSQTVYVWLDALINYLTAAGYGKDKEAFNQTWPPDVQVIGKDILKFHGIYWPAFLMAAGLELPKTILCHSHWTVDGEKMSKSKGNVVCPFDRAETYTTDGLRYFLLREGVGHSDGNYSDTKVLRILNSELADTLGNLLNRCTGSALNPRQTFPTMDSAALATVRSLEVTKSLIEHISNLPETCRCHYADFNFHKVADAIMATLHSANLFFETLKPWELKKKPESHLELNVVLHLTLETLRVVGILLQPMVPKLSEECWIKSMLEGKRDIFQIWRSFHGRRKTSTRGS